MPADSRPWRRRSLAPRDPLGLALLSIPSLGLYLPLALWFAHLGGEQGAASLGGGGWGELFAVTLAVAAGGAGGAFAVGGILALAFDRAQVRGRRVLLALYLAPLLLPPVVVTNALQAVVQALVHTSSAGTLWREVTQAVAAFLVRGVSGAIGISAAQMFPLVLWGTARALAAIPEAERAAVRLHLPPGRALTAVLARRALPAAATSALLAFLLLLPRMEVPSYAGVETVGVRVLAAFSSLENDREGMLLTAIVALVGIAPAVAAGLLLARSAPRPLGEERQWDRRTAARDLGAQLLGRALWGGAILVVAPLLALAMAAWGPVSGPELSYAVRGIAVDSVRCLALAAALALAGWRLAECHRGAAILLASAPLLLPGSLPGLALAQEAQQWLPASLFSLPLLLSLGQATRFFGVAVLFGALAHAALPRAEARAAQALPPRLRRWRVLLPRALPILATSTLVLFLLLLGEVESAALTVPPGYTAPALELEQALHFRFDEQAARLSALLALVAGAAALALGRLGRGIR